MIHQLNQQPSEDPNYTSIVSKQSSYTSNFPIFSLSSPVSTTTSKMSLLASTFSLHHFPAAMAIFQTFQPSLVGSSRQGHRVSWSVRLSVLRKEEEEEEEIHTLLTNFCSGKWKMAFCNLFSVPSPLPSTLQKPIPISTTTSSINPTTTTITTIISNPPRPTNQPSSSSSRYPSGSVDHPSKYVIFLSQSIPKCYRFLQTPKYVYPCEQNSIGPAVPTDRHKDRPSTWKGHR